MTRNEVALAGKLTVIEALRYTPAGVPLVGFRIRHRSAQTEAGTERQVECEMSGVAMADAALALAGLKPGAAITVHGFLNRKDRTSAQVILHATGTEF